MATRGAYIYRGDTSWRFTERDHLTFSELRSFLVTRPLMIKTLLEHDKRQAVTGHRPGTVGRRQDQHEYYAGYHSLTWFDG